ncbi:MAG: hypothetical protein WAU57_14155 [Xanthobacteraceae bacterium]
MNIPWTIPDQTQSDGRHLVNGFWSLWDMITQFGLKFSQAIIQLEEAKWLCMPFQLPEGQQPVDPNFVRRAAAAGLRSMREVCILSDMDDVLPELDRVFYLIEPIDPSIPPAPLMGLSQAINHLLSRLQDDLQQQFFFHVMQQDVQFYGNRSFFGELVAKKFKDAGDDIQRAGNCLAFHEPTACVFHLMRAMEVVVRQLSKRLKVTITPQTTWRQMTRNMDPKIKAMPEATPRQKEKKNDWEAARANLHHVGSVWRNNTMHPATSYTQSQALDVINAVRVFMIGLSAL